MITKFIKICNIGKFSNFSAHGNISLCKTNIIYGENSSGKTTLGCIIRSWCKNDAILINARKKYGSSGNVFCEILYGDTQQVVHKFENNAWNGNLQNVDVFDEYFIDENIYTGLEISSDHQKKLYQFALGEEGVALAKEVENIKRENETRNRNLSELKKQIELMAEECFSVEEFVNLCEDKDIETKIEQKKQEIKTAEAHKEVDEKLTLSEISLLSLSFDLDVLKSLLQRSIEEISAESLEKVEAHLEKLKTVIKDKAEMWLQDGLIFVENSGERKCPFCQKMLDESENVIKVYQHYYSEEYRQTKSDVESYQKEIDCVPIEEELNDRAKIALKNKSLVEFWKQHLQSLCEPDLDLVHLSRAIKTSFAELKQVVNKKLASVLKSVEAGCIDNLANTVNELNEKLSGYNTMIKEWNTKITELKGRQVNLMLLNQELEKLEAHQKRFKEDISELCENYKTIISEIKSNQDRLETKKEELNTAVSQKINDYGNSVNQYLEKFAVPFRIKESKPTYRGKSKEPYLEYNLILSDFEVNPLEKAKYTLSGGDKNSLALAFFLAKVNTDKDIDNKIVVFDDPVSSLDKNRRRRTAEYIRELASKAKQVIILTHYDVFSFELYEMLKKAGLLPKVLEISNGQINEWHIEEQMKHPYFIRISMLEKFVGDEEKLSSTEIRESIRLILEDALKFRYFKYFGKLGENRWLKPMIEALAKATEEDKTFKFRHSNSEEVLKELINLCDFSGPSHHGNIDQPHKDTQTQEEIKNYVESTLKLIYYWL